MKETFQMEGRLKFHKCKTDRTKRLIHLTKILVHYQFVKLFKDDLRYPINNFIVHKFIVSIYFNAP